MVAIAQAATTVETAGRFFQTIAELLGQTPTQTKGGRRSPPGGLAFRLRPRLLRDVCAALALVSGHEPVRRYSPLWVGMISTRSLPGHGGDRLGKDQYR